MVLNIFLGSAPKYIIDGIVSDEVQTCFNIAFMPALVVALLSGFVFSPILKKIGTLWKCLAAFVIVGVVAIIFPVNDIYFYIADIIAILLTSWTVLDIVRSHNLLTMRKLPQFGKRGGDEHEY